MTPQIKHLNDPEKNLAEAHPDYKCIRQFLEFGGIATMRICQIDNDGLRIDAIVEHAVETKNGIERFMQVLPIVTPILIERM